MIIDDVSKQLIKLALFLDKKVPGVVSEIWIDTSDVEEIKSNLPTDDKIVDLSDYSILVANFFSTNPSNSRADINDDGIVDLSDYSFLVANFFATCQ